jgi:hypothetical protein
MVMIKYFSLFAENWFHNLLLAKSCREHLQNGRDIYFASSVSIIQNAETMNP